MDAARAERVQHCWPSSQDDVEGIGELANLLENSWMTLESSDRTLSLKPAWIVAFRSRARLTMRQKPLTFDQPRRARGRFGQG